MRLSHRLDTLAGRVPESLKPLLAPAYPFYRRVLDMWFSQLPERTSRTPWGPRIRVDPANYVERRLSHGTFETAVVEHFREELIADADCFVDVGANVGFYSLLFAMETDGRVYAFEPLPRNVQRFRSNLELNDVGGITLHEFGISDESSTATLAVADQHPGEASLADAPKSATADQTVEVELRPFDDVVEDLDGPDLMKVDVEGAECRVIDGAKGSLAAHRPTLLLELHQDLLPEFGDDVTTVRSLLEASGYERVLRIETGDWIDISNLTTEFVADHSNVRVE